MDVVATREAGARQERPPLVVLEPLREFLASAGLGHGPIDAHPLGDGHSNVTYLLTSDAGRIVLRRPPRGPLPRSAHDVLREARLLVALAAAGVRVPEVIASCDDPEVIGAPFYLMHFIDGHVLSTQLPPVFDDTRDPAAIALQLVKGLAELHAVDLVATGLAAFGPGEGYLERQVRRFRGLLEQNAVRPLPGLHEVADWLDANRPCSTASTLVHGDYRLGNTIFVARPQPRLVGILDWEMATVGDPLADLGYLTAMWARPGDRDDPMLELSAVTRRPGFPSRAALVEAYERESGREARDSLWYQTLAIWKAAIFLESSHKRFLAGTTDDPYFARLGPGVPALARRALDGIDGRGQRRRSTS